MNNLHSYFRFVFFTLSALFLFACSDTSRAEGGSDHPNEIVGRILPMDGVTGQTLVARLYLVELFEAQVNMSTSFLAKSQHMALDGQDSIPWIQENKSTMPIMDTCDAEGYFRFTGMQSGWYRIETFSADSQYVRLSEIVSVGLEDSVTVPAVSLQPSTSIWLTLPADSSIGCDSTLFLVGSPSQAYSPSKPNEGAPNYCIFPFVSQGDSFHIAQKSDTVRILGTVKAQSLDSNTWQPLGVNPNGIIVCPAIPTCDSGQYLGVVHADEYGCVLEYRCELSRQTFNSLVADTAQGLWNSDMIYMEDTNFVIDSIYPIGSVFLFRLPVSDTIQADWILQSDSALGYAVQSDRKYQPTYDTLHPYEQLIVFRSLSLQRQTLSWVYRDTIASIPQDTTFRFLLQTIE